MLAIAAWAVLSAPTTYTIQEKPSTVYVQVFRASGVMSGLAHDHVVRATELRGEITFDPDNPATCKVSVTVPVKSLAVDEPALRRKLGYKGELGEDDRADIRESMLAEGQLNAAAHPEITFNADACVKTGDGQYAMAGVLNIRGKGHSVEVPLQVNIDGKQLRGRGKFQVKHTDFGIEPYSALFGSISNRNEMTFVLNVVAEAA